MNLKDLKDWAQSVIAIAAATSLLLGIAGRLTWDYWLKERIRSVVVEEVAPVRLGIVEIAQALVEPDSARREVARRHSIGPKGEGKP